MPYFGWFGESENHLIYVHVLSLSIYIVFWGKFVYKNEHNSILVQTLNLNSVIEVKINIKTQ